MKLLNVICIILLAVAFYFKGYTLYWVDTENKDQSFNWLNLQLDHKQIPTINKLPIEYITVREQEVYIAAGEYLWILHYDNPDAYNWWVSDPIIKR